MLLAACSGSTEQEASMSVCEILGADFLNDGGPMLVLSAHQLGEWQGSPLDADDPVSGDYARACEIEAATGLLDIPAGTAVAVSCDDLYYPIRWMRDGAAWLVVGWTYGTDDAESRLIDMLQSGSTPPWEPVARDLPVRGGLVLFHAASAGTDFQVPDAEAGTVSMVASAHSLRDDAAVIGDALVAHVPDGSYDLEHAYVELDDENACAIWRWSPSGDTR